MTALSIWNKGRMHGKTLWHEMNYTAVQLPGASHAALRNGWDLQAHQDTSPSRGVVKDLVTRRMMTNVTCTLVSSREGSLISFFPWLQSSRTSDKTQMAGTISKENPTQHIGVLLVSLAHLKPWIFSTALHMPSLLEPHLALPSQPRLTGTALKILIKMAASLVPIGTLLVSNKLMWHRTISTLYEEINISRYCIGLWTSKGCAYLDRAGRGDDESLVTSETKDSHNSHMI